MTRKINESGLKKVMAGMKKANDKYELNKKKSNKK